MIPDIRRPVTFRLSLKTPLSNQIVDVDVTMMATETSVGPARDYQQEASTGAGQTTVFYDGSCPLCSAEIAYYRRMDPHERLLFMDVSGADVVLEPELDRKALMARFHVRRANGQLLSGAAAFVSLWSLLPRWRWIAYAAAAPGAMLLLEMAYRLFLPVRPLISRLFIAVCQPTSVRKRFSTAAAENRAHDAT
jgi:predicted DCC family thiol-disulfide oxidoreductase YuxK